MSSKAATGEPTEYDDPEEGRIASALDLAWDTYEPSGEVDEEGALVEDLPTSMTVTADIEWSGESRGVRTVTFDNLQLGGVKERLDLARQYSTGADRAGRPSSYRARGWHAQLRALTGSGERGSTAADRAELDPTARTLRAWLAQDRQPNAANQRRITEAYERLATFRADTARDQAQQERHAAVSALSNELETRYGQPVRILDVQSIELD